MSAMNDTNEMDEQVLLRVRDLKKHFPIRRGVMQRVVGNVRAVDGVSFDLKMGETLALVGESGCGKTTTSRCILRALKPTDGDIHYTCNSGEVINLATIPKRDLRPVRREIQMIFQDPFSSLNPRMTLFDIIGEPMLVNGVRDRQKRLDRVTELLHRVSALTPACCSTASAIRLRLVRA